MTNLDRIAEANRKAEAFADRMLDRAVRNPWTWVILAAYGLLCLVIGAALF